ncbi:hypothetical protein KW782_04720 [Candidatus Parcubacteria bacterium]|nr:hypothetical protein [Candidatus Parcubacteria bacterium]
MRLPVDRTSGFGGTLLLNLNLGSVGLPPNFDFEGRRWVAKIEHHVTLLGSAHKSQLMQSCVGDKDTKQRQIAQAVAEAKQGIVFTVEPYPEVRLVTKDYPGKGLRTSIVLMCRAFGSDNFYRSLQAKINQDLGVIPHHITLYTADDPESRQGIGINSLSDLEQLSRIIGMNDLPPSVRESILKLTS